MMTFRVVRKDKRLEVWRENKLAGYVDPETDILFGIGADGYAHKIGTVGRTDNPASMIASWRIHPKS